MKPGNQTSEFYITAISSLVGVGVFFGMVTLDQAATLINALGTIASAVLAVAPAVAYIWSRTWLKGKAMSATTSYGTATTTSPTGAVTTTDVARVPSVSAGAGDTDSTTQAAA